MVVRNSQILKKTKLVHKIVNTHYQNSNSHNQSLKDQYITYIQDQYDLIKVINIFIQTHKPKLNFKKGFKH